MQSHIRNKPRRKAIGDRLKNPNDPLKLVIVRDMWLTGFDAPCLHTLYVDKPMRGHNLMQAIARVNRVLQKDKEGGLIVDYLGIAQDLKKALSVYTSSGGKGKIEFDQEEAVAKMEELYEIVVDLFHGFDYKRFFTLQPREKLTFLLDATDFILGLDKGQERFSTNVSNLSKAFAISVPHPKAIEIRDDLSFFQAIKARISKLRESNKKRSDEEVETAIRQIISDALISTEVIDIFQAAGLQNPEISGLNILSDEFMAELKDMPRKNLALELLRRLLNDEIKQRSQRNIIQSKKFSEMLADAIKRYQNNAITAAEIIEELIRLAKEIKEADKRGENLNLDFRELAFYDALEVSDSAVQILGDDILKTIARELVVSVRNSVTIDWDKKESVQAKMRVMIKRILKKYGYPPEKQDQAVKTILEQAKMIADDFSNNK
jgi:type I restriction enzyme, R subunit